MPFKYKHPHRHKFNPPKYRTTNWKSYNQGYCVVTPGSVLFWPLLTQHPDHKLYSFKESRMPFKHTQSRSHHISQRRSQKKRDWSSYNNKMKMRGDIAI